MLYKIPGTEDKGGLELKGTVFREKSEAQKLKEQCLEKESSSLRQRGERWSVGSWYSYISSKFKILKSKV